MKTLIENWNKFVEQAEVEQDTLQQIKDSPQEATDLIKKAAQATPQELKALLQTLIKDPEIAQTVKALKNIASEQNIKEGALADKMLQTYIQGDIAVQNFFSTPAGQKIKKFGGPVLAMALLTLKISNPPASNSDLQAMMKLASQATPATDVAADSLFSVLQPTTI